MAVGNPDWTKGVIPVRTTIGSDQTHWSYYFTGAIPATSNTTVTAYTVTAGKRLFLLGGWFSCEVSAIQRVDLYVDSTIWATFLYDVSLAGIITADGAKIVEAGEALKFKAYNNDTVQRTFFGQMTGFLVDV